MASRVPRPRALWPYDREGEVLVVGRRNVQNELLVHSLSHITGFRCYLVPKPDGNRQAPDKDLRCTLVLVDSTDTHLSEIAALSSMYTRKRDSAIPLALYNLRPGTGCEAAAATLGVKGFFYAHESLEMFLKGIWAVIQGEIWLPRETLVDAVISKLTGRKAEAGWRGELTTRETQVLSLLGQGARNDEIAESLGIGLNTVRTHLHTVFVKLGVANRSQAALWAARHLEPH